MDKSDKPLENTTPDLEKEEIDKYLYAAELARSDKKYLEAIGNLQKASNLASLPRIEVELAKKSREEIKELRARIANEAKIERERVRQLRKLEEERKQKEEMKAEKQKKASPVMRAAKVALGAAAATAAIPAATKYAVLSALHMKAMGISAVAAPAIKHRLASAGLATAAVLFTPALIRRFRNRIHGARPIKQHLAALHSFGQQAMVRVINPMLSAIGFP
jgi:hypothetical protein